MDAATVLIADDDEALLGLMLRRVQRMNLRADSAQDGSRASALLEQGEYHLLITDINMPGKNGLELLEQARERDPNLQVVIVTGGATLETAIQALNNGAFAYLTKPFDHISVLENTAYRALEYRRLRIDNQRMAAIQRRRGDMLEQEVADRLLQVSRQDREMREIMAQLPEGILILGGNRGLVPGNESGKRWLERDLGSAERPISTFLESVRGREDLAPSLAYLDGRTLQLTAIRLSSQGTAGSRVVVIRDLTEEGREITAEMVAPLAGFAHGLARLLSLAGSGDVRDVILQLVTHLRALEGLRRNYAGAAPSESIQQPTPANLPSTRWY
ncbi:MAG: response regulator [Anaerolineales bacterium]|nr:response regulator [Anaerolineales bacterium]